MSRFLRRALRTRGLACPVRTTRLRSGTDGYSGVLKEIHLPVASCAIRRCFNGLPRIRPNRDLARALLDLEVCDGKANTLGGCVTERRFEPKAIMPPRPERRLTMKCLMTTLTCLSILFLSVSCVAHRTCSGEEMVKMKDGGFSVEDINRTCTSYKISDKFMEEAGGIIRQELDRRYPNGHQPAVPRTANSVASTSVATTCATQGGVCPLIQPGVTGAPCVCNSWYGQFPGVMR